VAGAFVAKSMELAAERGGDITALVYRKLFQERPDLESLFVMDTDGAVRGSMLSWVISVLSDYTGDRRYAENLIRAEAANHDAYGLPAGAFCLFFDVVARTIRDVIGREWSAEMDEDWKALLAELDGIVASAS
jgi:hemoglobin-like flavoprotein